MQFPKCTVINIKYLPLSKPDLQVRKLAYRFYYLLKENIFKENTTKRSQIQHFKCVSIKHIFLVNSTFNTGTKWGCRKEKKTNIDFWLQKQEANHTIPISKMNIIPALVEMSAQSFLIKKAFQTIASGRWQKSGNSLVPH